MIIKRRKSKWTRHILKHQGLLELTLEGSVEGTNHRKPGKKPNKALFRQHNRRIRDDEAFTSR